MTSWYINSFKNSTIKNGNFIVPLLSISVDEMVKEHIKLGIQEHFIGTKGAIGGLRQSNTQRGKHQDTMTGFGKKLKTNPSARLDTKKLRDPAGLDPDGKKPTGNNEMVPTGLVEKTEHIQNIHNRKVVFYLLD